MGRARTSLGLEFIRRGCSGVQLGGAEAHGCFLECAWWQVGAGRPEGLLVAGGGQDNCQGRGLPGWIFNLNPLGPTPFSRWSHQPWGSFRTHRGPMALQQESQGQLSERRRGALQRPRGSGEGGSPEYSSQAPPRGLLVPLPPRPPPPVLHPPSRFFPP